MKRFNFFQKSVVGLSLALASIFLISTGFSHKKLHPLKPITAQALKPLVQEQSRVVISANILSGSESKDLFSHDFPSRDVYPLQITIQNNTAQSYGLSAGSVDLPRLNASKVAFQVTKSTIPRSIAYRVVSLFFWPAAVPGTIDSIKTLVRHERIKQEIKAKSLKDEEGETLAPYSRMDRVLFVKKEHAKDPFKVTLIDLETLQPTEFQVNLDS